MIRWKKLMAEQFIVEFNSEENETLFWCILDDVEIIESGTTALGELSNLQSKFTNLNMIAILPSKDCLLTNVKVPSSQRRQQIKAVPYILEEQIADDIETMHFAIGKKNESEELPVCAISKSTLSGYLSKLRKQGFSPSSVTVLTSLIDSPKDAWSLFHYHDQYLVNQDGECWSGKAEDVSLMLGLSIDRLDANIRPKFLVWDQEQPANWIDDLGLETIFTQVRDSQQALYSRINGQTINLLQGEFEVQDDWSNIWKVWKRVAVVASIAIILKFILMAINLGMLKSKQAYYKQEIVDTYHQVAPSARVVNAKKQMQQLLGNLGGDSGSQSFLVLLNKVAEAMSKIPKVVPTNISYDGKRSEIRIDLLVSSLPDLDRLKELLSGKGLAIEMGGASAQGNQYSGRIIVRGDQ